MKAVTIRDEYSTDTGILLETVDDVNEHFEIASSDFAFDFLKFHKESKSPEDFLTGDSSLFKLGAMVSQRTGKSAVVEASKFLDRKMNTIFSMICFDGRSVFINCNGGYRPLSDKAEILESKVIGSQKKQIVHVAKSPSLINLENDPEIEDKTIQYFKSNNLELSYICHLRNFTEDDLIETFNDFGKKGGYGVHVYTTGSDVDQMFEYANAIIKSSMKSVVFEFNAGIFDGHDEVIALLKENKIKVSIL